MLSRGHRRETAQHTIVSRWRDARLAEFNIIDAIRHRLWPPEARNQKGEQVEPVGKLVSSSHFRDTAQTLMIALGFWTPMLIIEAAA
jgi:hypothetical protein